MTHSLDGANTSQSSKATMSTSGSTLLRNVYVNGGVFNIESLPERCLPPYFPRGSGLEIANQGCPHFNFRKRGGS